MALDKITASELRILLGVYYDVDFARSLPTLVRLEERGVGIATRTLCANQLIKEAGMDGYSVTDKGTVFLHAILSTPLPEMKWVMPEGV